ncbi:hypothetical protein SVA_3780 [Sulfurifustis variabilis]|uniref:Uncharacterized protein n=1 Tax=Sulfurifustis variabilis TaxID=1675686 RepID=A0A1B4VBZ9_9GAMM|nr:hypothetical protein [Sulfurifustis variabilis]BAU50314.1 hypothetical protein SVA_3780 [Sulfurifustis variabilis]
MRYPEQVAEDGRAAHRCRHRSVVAALLALVGIGMTSPATAGDVSLLINGKAFHIDPPANTNYNERNWGVGIQYELDERVKENWVTFLQASEFRDSNRNVSAYAGGGLMRRYEFRSGDVRLDAGAIAFLMYRKDFRGGNLFPGVLPALSIGTPRVALNLSYVPKVDPKMVPIVFVQLKLTLGKL